MINEMELHHIEEDRMNLLFERTCNTDRSEVMSKINEYCKNKEVKENILFYTKNSKEFYLVDLDSGITVSWDNKLEDGFFRCTLDEEHFTEDDFETVLEWFAFILYGRCRRY